MVGNFETLISEQRPIVVDFHALWCAPCKVQTPILKEVAQEVGEAARILKIDIDKHPALAQRYRIQSVPTLIVFKGGAIVWRKSGVASKGEIMAVIQNNK